MARQYKLRSFLRYLDDALILEYFQAKGIQQALPSKDDKEAPADYWERTIRGFPQKESDAIEADFQDINEMALESGTLSLIQVGRDQGIDITSQIKDIENEHNKALFCFLRHRQVFDDTATLHWIEELRSKKERTGLRIRTVEQVIAHQAALAEKLRNYFFSQDGRGARCQVDVHAFSNRVCFIAYPEDYATSDFQYEGEQLKRTSRRPCFEVVFIYYTDCGRLELFAKGGKDREQALMDFFNLTVLEDDKPLDPMQKIYDLNKLFDDDFDLPTRLEDQVQDIRVKLLRFDFKLGGKQRITLEMDQDGGLKPMQELMKHKGINAQYYNIRQARIYMKFPGKGRRGSVTI